MVVYMDLEFTLRPGIETSAEFFEHTRAGARQRRMTETRRTSAERIDPVRAVRRDLRKGWGRLAGKWHDPGKYNQTFSNTLKSLKKERFVKNCGLTPTWEARKSWDFLTVTLALLLRP